MHQFRKLEYYVMSQDEELTAERLGQFIREHQLDCARFRFLRDMYEGVHPILFQPNKPAYKPDNRMICNFAKYIVDTLNGYFIGIPVKTICDDNEISEEIAEILIRNDQDDNNAELAKICSIYGSGFEWLYVDEKSQPCITYMTPLEGFVIYDDSVARRPLYGVHYYKTQDGETVGSVYDREKETKFSDSGGLHYVGGGISHKFRGVPMVEYIENEERQGAFEQVTSLICAYEKALSEKANDVDYFADAYLKLIGVRLDEEGKELFKINETRIIQVDNMDAEDMAAIDVGFLEKPSADATQENLLNRLENQIFSMSMVSNISDETFGSASGTALAYRLLPMQNLAALKQRKFTSGMNLRWKLIASSEATRMPADAYKDIIYRFTRNAPKNLLEEVQTASQMAGITSRETQLSVISAVDDVRSEMQKLDAENGEPADALRIERVTESNVLE